MLKDVCANNETELGRNSRVLFVDGLNTFIRAYSVSPTTNSEGIPVGGISGFLLSVGYAIKMLRPTRLVIIFDGKGGSSARRKLYSEYKNNRKPLSRPNRINPLLDLDQEIDLRTSMLIRLQDYLKCIPATVIQLDNVEADDVIGYLSTRNAEKSYIMSSDKDFLQLVSDKISVWSPTKKVLFTPNDVLSHYNIRAENFIIYRCIVGDTGDNIKGVPGIKEKSIAKYLPFMKEERCDTIDTLLQHCSQLDNKITAKLIAAEDQLRTNYKLMQLAEVTISDMAKERSLALFRSKHIPGNKHAFTKLLIEDKMESAIKNFDLWFRDVFGKLEKYE